MAAEVTRVDIGFDGGQVLTVRVATPDYEALRKALGSEKAVSLIALYAHAIPHVFSPATLAEAARARPASLEGREDWRSLPLLTIDPPDAKDHDDAVHARADDDARNPGGFVLSIAIADVVQPEWV